MKQFVKFLMVMVMVLVGITAVGIDTANAAPTEDYETELMIWGGPGDNIMVRIMAPVGSPLPSNLRLTTGLGQEISFTVTWSECPSSWQTPKYRCDVALLSFDGEPYTLDEGGQQFNAHAYWGTTGYAYDYEVMDYFLATPDPDACGLTGCD
ncbi:MAG TPA: hypothetical protein VLL52_16830 [Anaerolineae bacterium]|nr:hypothetical protein [Anaerolineae bacterium]